MQNLIQIPKCEVSSIGLKISSAVTLPEWSAIGQSLTTIQGATLWLLGDWLAHGVAKWGEKYKEAECLTELDYGTLRNAVFVSENVSLSLRNDKLKWWHHYEVASLSPHDQGRWLTIAAEKEMSVRRLRASIKAGRILTEEEMHADSGATGPIITVESLRLRFGLWLSKCDVEKDRKPVEWWRTVETNLRPLVEFYQRDVLPRVKRGN